MGGQHELDLVPEGDQLARPALGCRAGFHASEARGATPLKNSKHLRRSQPSPDDDFPGCVDTVDPKPVLAEVVPLLFGLDVLRGHLTIFPIPLAEAGFVRSPMEAHGGRGGHRSRKRWNRPDCPGGRRWTSSVSQGKHRCRALGAGIWKGWPAIETGARSWA
jgi:hypothetical protein